VWAVWGCGVTPYLYPLPLTPKILPPPKLFFSLENHFF
jgi:hypothetical protein